MNMESRQKRQRSANFSKKEKALLLSLITDRKAIIENKKSDAVTWRAKESAWAKIAATFNYTACEGNMRTVSSLKKIYMNLKRANQQNALEGLVLDVANAKTIFGMDFPMDSEQDHNQHDHQEKHEIETTNTIMQTPTSTSQMPNISDLNNQSSRDVTEKCFDYTSQQKLLLELQIQNAEAECIAKERMNALQIQALELEVENNKKINGLKIQALELEIESRRLDVQLKMKQL